MSPQNKPEEEQLIDESSFENADDSKERVQSLTKSPRASNLINPLQMPIQPSKKYSNKVVSEKSIEVGAFHNSVNQTLHQINISSH
jgi:hypothetical protein